MLIVPPQLVYAAFKVLSCDRVRLMVRVHMGHAARLDGAHVHSVFAFHAVRVFHQQLGGCINDST